MSDEPIEDLPAQADPGGASRGNPWLPVIAIVLLVPALSFATAEFILLPKIVAALGDTAKAPAGGGGAAAGGHGDHGGGPTSNPDGEPIIYEIKDVVANLAGPLKSRYVKVTFTLYGSREDFAEFIARNEPMLVDTTIGILATLSLADLDEPGVKNVVRNDLIRAFSTALNGPYIENLYFSDFVIQ